MKILTSIPYFRELVQITHLANLDDYLKEDPLDGEVTHFKDETEAMFGLTNFVFR